MQELAINGGTPVRENRINYGRQWIDEEDNNAVIEDVCYFRKVEVENV